MNKFLLLLFCSFYISFSFSSCGRDEYIEGIYISELLLINAKKKECSYVELVKKSLKKDTMSVKTISKLKFYDAVSYDHGAVLVEIINRIGEKEYIKLLGNITVEEKQNILADINVGLEYGDVKK